MPVGAAATVTRDVPEGVTIDDRESVGLAHLGGSLRNIHRQHTFWCLIHSGVPPPQILASRSTWQYPPQAVL